MSLVRRLVFYLVPCSSSGAYGLRSLPCRWLPLGVFCPFSATVCLTYCCAGGVSWSATLLFCYRCLSCTGWLAGVHWVLLPVSGGSHRACVCSVVDSIVVLLGSTCLWAFVCCSVVSTCGSGLLWRLCGSLLAFPCLRVGALLACGVSGASSLRSLQSRLPFVVGPHVHVSVCPSPALAVGRFGPRYGAPPAAPVCWVFMGSLLPRSVALAFGRTLFLLLCLTGFLPLALVGTWVGRLRSCLGSCLLLVGTLLPLS